MDNNYIQPFSSLNDAQLIAELLSDNNQYTLPYHVYEKLLFNYIDDNDYGNNVLDDVDPDPIILSSHVTLCSCNYYQHSELSDLLKNDQNSSTIIFQNIRSIPENFDSFRVQYIDSLIPYINIIGLCETRLTNNIEDLYCLPSYDLYTNNNARNKGGVAIFTRQNINCKKINELCIMSNSFESVFVECVINDVNNSYGVIYRRPSSNNDDFITNLLCILEYTKQKRGKCYIMGDFNYDLLKYESYDVIRNYVHIMYSFGFYPCINRPTRVSCNSATIIDNIWTNDTTSLRTNGILMTDQSDHFAPFTKIFFNSNPLYSNDKYIELTYRDFKSCSKEEMCATMMESLTEFRLSNDVNESYTSLSNILSNVTNSCFPVKTKTIKSKAAANPWITNEIKQLIKDKNKLYKKFVKRPITYGEEYRNLRNRVNVEVRNAKKSFYGTKFQEVAGDSKKVWEILNNILNRTQKKKGFIDSIKINEEILTDPQAMCNSMNNYFVNIGRKMNESLPPSDTNPLQYLRGVYSNNFVITPTSFEEINKTVKDLKVTSPGYDELHVNLLRNTIHIIGPVLVDIINLSFHQGIFPDLLKIAMLIPLLKSSVKEANNLRPISILTTISKLIEKLVFDRLLTYLLDNNIIIHEQFAYLKSLSPQSAIVYLLDKIMNYLDRGEYVIGVFLDLSKAFDSISHEILLKKLSFYGVRGTALKWFSSYLSDRKQYTYLNNCKSTFASVTHGVPQGSTLGPLLFLVYVNDIINSSTILQFLLFADDTNVFYNGKNVTEMCVTVNIELQKLSKWFITNRLSINSTKLHFVLFAGNKHVPNNINIQFDGIILNQEFSTKFLGIIIDSKLNWKKHVDYIQGKLSKICGIMHNIAYLLTAEAKILLYYSLFYPYIQYCNVAWGSASNATLKSLTLLQKRCIRTISGSGFRDHTNPLFKNLGILKINDVYILESLKFVNNQLKNPNVYNFQRVSDVHNVNTRNINHLRPRLAHTSLSKKFVTYSGCNLWNNLPLELRTITNNVTFKIKCKKHLLSKY